MRARLRLTATQVATCASTRARSGAFAESAGRAGQRWVWMRRAAAAATPAAAVATSAAAGAAAAGADTVEDAGVLFDSSSAGAAQDARAAEALVPTLLDDVVARVRDRVRARGVQDGAGRAKDGAVRGEAVPRVGRQLALALAFAPLRRSVARELNVKLL